MPRHPGTRAAQSTTSHGLGEHFMSPRKARNRLKSATYVSIPGRERKRQLLLKQLQQLLNERPQNATQPRTPSPPPIDPSVEALNSPFTEAAMESIDDDIDDIDLTQIDHDGTELQPDILRPPRPPRTRSAENQYEKWKATIPALVIPFVAYLEDTLGKPAPHPAPSISWCKATCECKKNELIALYYDYFQPITILSCQCASLSQVLIHHGLFPTAPSQPRMAVSVELLSFYRALFERSCDAVNALAHALNTHYSRRGFRFTNKDGSSVQEPFRRSLGKAVQWFDVLQVEVERHLDSILSDCHKRIIQHGNSDDLRSREVTSQQNPSDSTDLRSEGSNGQSAEYGPASGPTVCPIPDNTPTLSCDPLLTQRCPACFGGTSFGRPLADGADIHVATDGNFHHRHRRSAGDSPAFYQPQYFIPKSQVDAVGKRLEKVRKRPARQHRARVPDEAVDNCESTYEAADGHKQKTSMESFDDTGLMALICRHDIPLFFANIDTPGEQQKYSVSLIEHLYSLLPPNATVVLLYDVGCVLDRSIGRYDILDPSIASRLRFATTAMHAYGHEWACQLEYNPRLVKGVGLTDGEGTERLWSRFIKLIGVERSSARQRRIWLIDRQAESVGKEMLRDLGAWQKRRVKKGIQEQGDAAQKIIETCAVSVPDLRSQWSEQRAAQLSVRSHAPARLKKELDTVLVLQAELDASDRALQTARVAITKDHSAPLAIDALDSMERTQNRLLEKVQTLYSSLNVEDQFPELDGVNLDFVRYLLMARDLKINIRKRAIGSFFEWDKLDRAVGGQDKALGTKLHQQTRKAIAKRQPALMSAIRKFNQYCEKLEKLYDPLYAIPLPTALPTKLAELRSDQTLLEDVWITPAEGHIPPWLEDRDVREGIRALLKRDRCHEEQVRLGKEADNMCRWFGKELAALELAVVLPEHRNYRLLLQQRREAVLELQNQWASPLASPARYASHALQARHVAAQVAGVNSSPSVEIHWLPPIICNLPPPPEDDVDPQGTDAPTSDEDEETPPEQVILGDVLADANHDADDGDADADDNVPLAEVNLHWQQPQNLTTDFFDIATIPTTSSAPLAERTRPPQRGFQGLVFEAKDLRMLASREARINDACVNGCAALLFSAHVVEEASQFAVFTTHDLPRIRYNAADEDLWRNTERTKYWEKPVWILPIHRPSNWGHWVLCSIHFETHRIMLFDSLAEEQPWQNDLLNIIALVTRLTTIAHARRGTPRRHQGAWHAVPVTASGKH